MTTSSSRPTCSTGTCRRSTRTRRAEVRLRRPDGIDYWEYQGQHTGSVGSQRGGVVATPGVGLRPGRPPGDAPGLLRPRPAGPRHGRQRRARVDVLPDLRGFNGMSLARSTVDQDLTKIVVSAYNDWHIDELAGEHPGRFLPLGDPAGVRHRRHGHRDRADRRQGLSRGEPARRRRTASGCRSSATRSTGTRCSGAASTTTSRSASTSAGRSV